MRIWVLVFLILEVAICGCARKKASSPEDNFSTLAPSGGSATVPALEQQLNLTAETAIIGKVAAVNNNGRFVVISFPIGHLPGTEQRMNLYRQGLKVGEIKITGPQQEDNVVADLTSGDAQVGDDVRDK